MLFATLQLWQFTTMLCVASAPRLPDLAFMTRESVDDPEARLLGRALRLLRKRANLTLPQAGERFGVTGEGWRKYESGQARSIFTPGTQEKLAVAVGATTRDLLDERARLTGETPRPQETAAPAERMSWAAARTPELTLLPIRDRVQAGAWLMADDSRQDAPTHPVARDPRYPQAEQWLSEVVGDSVNALNIVEGDLVHCVDAVALGYYPRTGDIVEVERRRFGGQERELTIKQVEVTPEGVLLWPRSHNVRWRTPLKILDGVDEGEDVEVGIRALVIASIRRF